MLALFFLKVKKLQLVNTQSVLAIFKGLLIMKIFHMRIQGNGCYFYFNFKDGEIKAQNS